MKFLNIYARRVWKVVPIGIFSLTVASAHQGPPFPILVDKASGPYIVSVWADPNVGFGKFYVMLDPPPGKALPIGTTVQISVRPVSGRLPEASYFAKREQLAREQYYVEVPFDAQERWRVRFTLRSAQGNGEVGTEVEVTPPGPGPYDWILYASPFVLVGGLWFRGMLRERRRAPVS
jgi:hypothetical protein